MNSSNIKYYNSTIGLTSKTTDILFVFVLPILGIFGILFISISISVLRNLLKIKKTKDQNIFKYMPNKIYKIDN